MVLCCRQNCKTSVWCLETSAWNSAPLKTGRHKNGKETCMNLLGCKKKDYFENRDLKLVGDKKMVWNSTASLFSNNSQKSINITLAEGSNIIIDDEKCRYFQFMF